VILLVLLLARAQVPEGARALSPEERAARHANDAAPAPVAPLGVDPRQTLEDVRGQERGILDQLNASDEELETVRAELDGLTDRFKALEAQRRAHEDQAASAEAVAGAFKSVVAVRLQALYKLERRGLARLVFGAEDTTELRRRAYYLLRVVAADRAKLAQFTKARMAGADAVAELDRNAEALKALRTELQLKEAELRDQRARKMGLLEDIRTQRSLAMRALSEEARTQQAFTQYAASAVSGAPEGLSSFRSAYGKLPCPTTGRLIHKMGPYRDALTGEQRESTGVDFAAEFGTPFRAVFAGEVIRVQFISGFGQTVMVQHGAYVTVYSHANGVRVRSGQHVEAGDILGNVGNSGLADTNSYMLGFQILYNNTYQDPLQWLATAGCG
jgi:murein DD-endopeptidase MepM/ murein hydrolase activator NlpD